MLQAKIVIPVKNGTCYVNGKVQYYANFDE